MLRLYKYGIVVIVEQKLLLCKAYDLDELILPGGVKEGNETYAEGIVREINEELGRSAYLAIDSLEYIGNFIDAAAGKPNTVVEIELYSGDISGQLKASDEIEQLVWFSETDNPSRLSAIVRDHIVPYLLLTEKLLWNIESYYKRRKQLSN